MNFFKQNKTIILDGALGTELQRRGHDVNDTLWSAKFLDQNPKAISEIHFDYLRAGADIIITASYQASIKGFIQKGFSEQRAIELIKSSISLAQKTRDEFWDKSEDKNTRSKPLVAASIGPYGAFLADGSEYSGDYNISDEELREFHKNRLAIIATQKPDIFACETLPCLREVKILCELLKQYPHIPAWISFSAKDEKHISSGELLGECVEFLETQNHISTIGINCTAPQFISPLLKVMMSSSKHKVIYPNGGSKYNPITKVWEKSVDNSDFIKMALLWRSKGATIIGGCCETGPEEIKQLSKTLK